MLVALPVAFGRTQQPHPATDYVCLDVRTEINKKKYQLHIIVNRNDINDYEIRCEKEVNSYTNLRSASSCQTNTITADDCDW